MNLILTLFAICVIWMAFSKPIWVVVPYGLTALAGDGFGVAMYLNALGAWWFLVVIKSACFLASIVSLKYLFIHRKRALKNNRFWKLALASQMIVLWIGLAWVFKGGGLLSMFNAMQYAGLILVPIVLASKKPIDLLNVTCLLLVIQLTIAILLVSPETSSSLQILNSLNYSEHSDLMYGQELGSRFSGALRAQAQFNNANAYGLYSIVGLLFGSLVFFFSSGWLRRSLGLWMAVSGGVGWIFTMSRGASFGLIIFVTAGIIFLTAYSKSWKAQRKLMPIILAFAASLAFILSNNFEEIVSLIPSSFLDDTELGGRLSALDVGWHVFFESPLLGVSNDFQWPGNVPPHQLPIYFMTQHGMLAGLFSLIIFSAPIVFLIRYVLARRTSLANPGAVIISFGSVGIFYGTSLTNNFSAPVIFWCCFGVALHFMLSPKDINI